MKSVNKLIVTYHSRSVGTLSMTPDNRLCAFQYDREWLANGFSSEKGKRDDIDYCRRVC
jgi:serine/threonine-protein kinase HipA